MNSRWTQNEFQRKKQIWIETWNLKKNKRMKLAKSKLIWKLKIENWKKFMVKMHKSNLIKFWKFEKDIQWKSRTQILLKYQI